MSYAYDAEFTLQTAQTGVSFFEELFGESKDENFYNYCPSVMMEGNDVMHVWYCSNKDSGQVTDYVAYRKGRAQRGGADGEFGEKTARSFLRRQARGMTYTPAIRPWSRGISP